MTTVLIDARPHVVAVKAAIETQLGAAADVYDYGKVPGADGNAGTLPNIYVLLTVERRFNPLQRSTAQAGAAGWRITARGVGRTADEARWAMFKVATALTEVRLTVAGAPTSPIRFESEQNPELDNGRHSGLSLYTYTR